MIVRKLVVSDGRTERELLLVGTIVVGRDPSCQLNDLDPLLSRRRVGRDDFLLATRNEQRKSHNRKKSEWN